jgi:hypothetical protein
MCCVITDIYNKKTKISTLIELFTATGKLKSEAAVTDIDEPMLTRVWQELECHIDVCHVIFSC